MTVSLGGIDQKLSQLEEELERADNDYAMVAHDKAQAEADWKAHKSRVLLHIANSGDKMSEDIREAKALQFVDQKTGESGESLYRTFLILDAEERSVDRHMKAVQARLTVFQSLSRGIRQATGSD